MKREDVNQKEKASAEYLPKREGARTQLPKKDVYRKEEPSTEENAM